MNMNMNMNWLVKLSSKFAIDQKPHLTAKIYMTSGAVIIAKHVESLEIVKDSDGSFKSYKIIWNKGYNPDLFSLTLNHISAIIVE